MSKKVKYKIFIADNIKRVEAKLSSYKLLKLEEYKIAKISLENNPKTATQGIATNKDSLIARTVFLPTSAKFLLLNA